MVKAPCKGCPDRVLGCHDDCIRYKKYKADMDDWRKEKEEFHIDTVLEQLHTHRKCTRRRDR